MSEFVAALGIVGLVAQLAQYGQQLSVKLITFTQVVSNADAILKDVSSDISMTSLILGDLQRHLANDEEGRLMSENSVKSAETTVQECMTVFRELDEMLTKSMKNLEGGKGARAWEKLKWSFVDGQMKLLKSNLDRLKAELTLMLNVLIYASTVRDRYNPSIPNWISI